MASNFGFGKTPIRKQHLIDSIKYKNHLETHDGALEIYFYDYDRKKEKNWTEVWIKGIMHNLFEFIRDGVDIVAPDILPYPIRDKNDLAKYHIFKKNVLGFINDAEVIVKTIFKELPSELHVTGFSYDNNVRKDVSKLINIGRHNLTIMSDAALCFSQEEQQPNIDNDYRMDGDTIISKHISRMRMGNKLKEKQREMEEFGMTKCHCSLCYEKH